MAEEESFKVTDRRGRARDVAPAESQAAPSAATPPGGAPARGPVSEPPPAGAGGAADLQGLFVTLASSALINLGEAADPGTGERQVDLDQAREAIDLLVLLRDKTAGNRTEQESGLLEDLLYDLQMRYVQAARSARRS